MKKSKIEISEKVLDAIRDSRVISEQEKLRLLKYVAYLTYDEQQELFATI